MEGRKEGKNEGKMGVREVDLSNIRISKGGIVRMYFVFL